MNASRTLKKLALAAALGAAAVPVALGDFAWAQTAIGSPNTAQDLDTPSSEVDSRNPIGGSLNPIDIMHNANLSRSRSAGEFAEDTRRNLRDAANEFKQLQLQRLQQLPASPSSEESE